MWVGKELSRFFFLPFEIDFRTFENANLHLASFLKYYQYEDTCKVIRNQRVKHLFLVYDFV